LQALDNFNTAVVSPIYYALFTAFTILASAIMFKVGVAHNHNMEICSSKERFYGLIIF
jgi:hypothetical protein